MRDDYFLKNRLESIWQMLFSEVERKNNVIIKFKGTYKNKFGHIKKLKNGDSEIIINGYFKNEKIPEYIIDLTIAHELVHYYHGFNSPHPKMFSHPHKGGIVNKELRRRGFGHVLKMEKKWIKEEWREIIKEEFKPRIKKRRLFRFF